MAQRCRCFPVVMAMVVMGVLGSTAAPHAAGSGSAIAYPGCPGTPLTGHPLNRSKAHPWSC